MNSNEASFVKRSTCRMMIRRKSRTSDGSLLVPLLTPFSSFPCDCDWGEQTHRIFSYLQIKLVWRMMQRMMSVKEYRLGTGAHFCSSQIEVNAVSAELNAFEWVVGESVHFELKGECGLDVPVHAVLCSEPVATAPRVVLHTTWAECIMQNARG